MRGMRDTPSRYGFISLAMHWSVAFLVIALIALGLLMEWTITFEDQSLYVSLKTLHISTGVLLCVVLPPRIIWRLVEGWKDSGHRHKALRIAAIVGPVSLLLLISAQAVFGILSRWTDKQWETGMAQTLPFFGMFEIPAIFSAPLPEWNHLLEDAHDVLNEVIIAVLLIHVAGAAFHWWRTAASRS